MADMAEYPAPEDRITALLAYVDGTRDVEAGGAAARVRLSAADAALALANDTGATAEVVTACVQAAKDCSVTVSVANRTCSAGTIFFSTTGRSAFSTTLCSSSVMAGPDSAASRLASVIGLRSTRTSSWLTETVWVTFSVTTYLGSRARPALAPRPRRE